MKFPKQAGLPPLTLAELELEPLLLVQHLLPSVKPPEDSGDISCRSVRLPTCLLLSSQLCRQNRTINKYVLRNGNTCLQQNRLSLGAYFNYLAYKLVLF